MSRRTVVMTNGDFSVGVHHPFMDPNRGTGLVCASESAIDMPAHFKLHRNLTNSDESFEVSKFNGRHCVYWGLAWALPKR